MNVDPCLAAYGLATALAIPPLLDGRLIVEDSPRLRLTTWLLAGATVVGSWLAASVSLAHHDGPIAQSVGILVGLLLVGRFAYALVVTRRDTYRSRRHHEAAARLVGRHDAKADVVMIESEERIAYSIPRLRGGLVVVTTGAREALTDGEFRAVLAHERAHLSGRHHILIEIGQIFARALPGLRLFRDLRHRVPELLEMVADDAAARRHGPRQVATAIASMSTRPVPEATLGGGGPWAATRALRLTVVTAGDRISSRVSLLALAVVLAAAPFLMHLAACPHPW
jgi:Zn-dependent protease with chaperone function